jgi:hypothetical protein
MIKALGCPFAWALEYRARLRAGQGGRLPDADSAALQGSLIHEFIAEILRQHPKSPEEGARSILKLLEEDGPHMVGSLFLETGLPALAKVRDTLTRSIQALLKGLAAGGHSIVSVETPCEAELSTGVFTGTPDLVIEDPLAVVDLKRSGTRYRQESLVEGVAFQLAAYAHILECNHPEAGEVTGAYFILQDAHCLTSSPGLFPGGQFCRGPRLPFVWDAMVALHAKRTEDLRRGLVAARGIPDGSGDPLPDKDVLNLEEGTLCVVAPCKFCDLGLLCGRDLLEVQA